MFRYYLLFIAVVFTTPAYSKLPNWYKLISGEKFDQYVDVNNVYINNNRFVHLWILVNYKERMSPNNPTQSTKALEKIDCLESSDVVIKFVVYSSQMGEGKVIYTAPDLPEKPDQIIPGSSMDVVKDRFCP